jgi:hypothetical protein
MKKHHSIRKSIFFAASFVLGAFLFTACEKEEQPILETPVETEQVADSIHDLAGYFNATLEVFFIEPEMIDQILEYMEAYPTSDGRYGITEVAEDGLLIDYFFLIVPMPIPEIYFQATAIEMEFDHSGADENGVRYKVYRNAQCGTSQRTNTGDCQNMAQIDPENEAASFKARVSETYKKCKRSRNSGDLCREKLLSVGDVRYYNDLDCQGAVVRTDPYKRYRCDY